MEIHIIFYFLFNITQINDSKINKYYIYNQNIVKIWRISIQKDLIFVY